MPGLRAISCMLLVAALALGLTSCVHLPGGPTASLLPVAQEVRARLQARQQAVSSFVLSGEVELAAPQGTLNGDHLIMGLAPNRIRAEIMGPFGQPLLRVITDGQKMAVLSYRENRAYMGRASRENLARFLGLALSSSEIYALLTGSVPLLPSTAQAEVIPSDSEKGMALLHLVEPGGQVAEGVVFDPGDYAIRRAWLESRDRGPNLDMSFDRFQEALGSRYPTQIKATDGQDRSLLLISHEMKLNQKVDASLFQVAVPPGLEVVELR
ncbi:LolA family protein [Desulfoferula mesophila]|uniref:LolA family protein n=1 Tax=Desulfoferula mesophila TaxID=3058419 RepID=UPI0030D5A6ED